MGTNSAIILAVIVVAIASAVLLFLRDKADRSSAREFRTGIQSNGRGARRARQGRAGTGATQKTRRNVLHPAAHGERSRRVHHAVARCSVAVRRRPAGGYWPGRQARRRGDGNPCGYPVGDFEQRSADLSINHPAVVQNYRAAHDIAVRRERGEGGTEDLRQAMIHFRALFDELVGEPEPAPAHAAS